MTNKIAEIRARLDRATLLAEIENLRAENERLRAKDTKTRHALKGWVWVCPDGGDEPTHERVAAVVAEVERQARHIEELREKIDAERSCACSFDSPSDVCAAHSPALTRALAENARLRAQVAEYFAEPDTHPVEREE